MAEPRQILETRYRLEKELIETGKREGYPVTAEMLADYFNVHPPAIQRDMDVLGISLPKAKHNAEWIRDKRNQRDHEINSLPAREVPSACAKFGLWRRPRDMEDPGWKMPKTKTVDEQTMKRALCLCKIGFRPTEALEYLGSSVPLYERELLDSLIRSRGYEPGHAFLNSDEKALEYARQCVKAKEKSHGVSKVIVDLAKLTGAKRTAIRKAVDRGGKSTRETTQKSRRVEKDKEKDALATKVYGMYESGMLQKDIAKELGVSRATISNYIRRVRVKNGKDPAEDRRRNTK